MLHYKNEIKIPNTKIYVNPKGYVYYTVKSIRKNGKPFPVRTLIGKKISETMMIPNDHYYEIYNVENEEDSKVEKETKKFIPNKVTNYGCTYLLIQIMKKLGLMSTLTKIFPNASSIANIAMYMLTSGNVMSYISHWSEETFTKDNENLSSQNVSRVFANINENDRINFFKEWSQKRIEDEYVAYDVTSISSYSDIDIVEWGYNRDKEKLPQINLGAYFGETSHLPIYYNVYSGSIVDKSQLEFMLKYNKILNIKKIRLVMDKGFYTAENIKHLCNEKIKFIVPITLSVKLATELLEIFTPTELQIEQNRLRGLNTYAQKKKNAITGEYKVAAHIYYNEEKAYIERQNLHDKIDMLETELSELKSLPEDISKYTKYFKISKNKSSFKYEKDYEKISKEEKTKGYLILLNNDLEMDSKSTIEIYRTKDCIEKNFDNLKNELDMKRLRTHNADTMQGKIFVAFIALIMKAQIENKAKKYMESNNATVQDILKEMNKVKILEYEDEKVLLQALTKKQKEILSIFEITENDLKASLE